MLQEALGQLPAPLGAIIIIGLVVTFSIAGGLLFHRYVPKADLIAHNDIAGFVFAVVGVLYAVLLAFLAVGAWERLQNAEQRTYEEAARLAVVYRKCDIFPEGHLLRSELRSYVREIIDQEYPLMLHGGRDYSARAMSEHIAYQIRHLPVQTMSQQDNHSAMVTSMDEAMVDRDSRVALAALGIGNFLWTVLIAGGMLTILFSYLFAYRSLPLLIAIVGLLAAMVGLVLYLIAAVDYPFRGEVRVGPEAFENALRVFQIIGT